MMKNIILILLLLRSIYGVSQAQTSFFSEWKPSISYYGNNFWNPGLLSGFEKVMTEKGISKSKNDQVKMIYRQYVMDAKLGFYYDNPSHIAVFNNYTINFRRLSHSGRYTMLGLGPGITRTFLPETYQINDKGEVELITLPGRLYFSPLFSVGSGTLWSKNGGPGLQIKLHTTLLINYNKYFNPLFNVELGYTFGYTKKSEWKE